MWYPVSGLGGLMTCPAVIRSEFCPDVDLVESGLRPLARRSKLLRKFYDLSCSYQIRILQIGVDGYDIIDGNVKLLGNLNQGLSGFDGINFSRNLTGGGLGNFELLAGMQDVRLRQAIDLGNQIPADIILLADIEKGIARLNGVFGPFRSGRSLG